MRVLAAILSVCFATVAVGAGPTSRPTVLLTRFAQLSETAGTEWIGRAVQESLLTDLLRDDGYLVVGDQHLATTDAATARQFGRDAGADLVVIGGYQQTGNDLRITGQIVETSSGSVVGTIKSTATENELIAMEDSISGQLERELNRGSTKLAEVNRRMEVVATLQPKVELQTLGAVKMANYSRPFMKASGDPEFVLHESVYLWAAGVVAVLLLFWMRVLWVWVSGGIWVWEFQFSDADGCDWVVRG